MPDTSEQKLRQMMEDIAEKKATEVYKKLGTRYAVASVPAHAHNGVDSNQLSQQYIVPNVGYNTGFVSAVFVGTGTVTLPCPPNMTRILVQGYAYNNSGPTTFLGISQGEAIFGRNYEAEQSGAGFVFDTGAPGTPFVQSSNSLYIDEADPTHTNPGASSFHIFFVIDETFTIVASIKVTSLNNNKLKLTVHLNANWHIAGVFTLR